MSTDKSELILAATGGAGAAAGALVTAWSNRKKGPAEVDSTIALGAESAVDSLTKALAAETARAERAEAKVREQDQKIAALERKIDALQAALDAVREELHGMKEA